METIKEIKEVAELFWAAFGWYCLIPPVIVFGCFYGAYKLEKKAYKLERDK